MSDDDIFGVMDDLNDEVGDPFANEQDDTKDDAIPATAGASIREPEEQPEEPAQPPAAVEPAPEPEPTPEPEPVAPPAGVPAEPVSAAPAPAKPKKPKGGHKKQARKPLTPRQKAIRVIMRRADVEEVMRICDIGLFIDEPSDPVLANIAKDCPCQNRVNLSAEVMLSQVKKVGSQILESGRMYQPIQVAKITEDGAFECTSGRHRLAFLALLYGAKASIKVYVEDMTLQEARDAVVVANMARPTKAMERAEHAVLQAVHGDADAEQDDMFKKTATTKSKAKKYCVFSVFKKGYPAKLEFKASLTSSRDGGTALTTITNIENFWGNALEWRKDMERAEFDDELKKSVEFLNAVAASFQSQGSFDASQHMASMVLSAIGKYYRDVESVTGNAISRADEIAKVIVAMGDIGRQKSDLTYSELSKALRK
jgi:hypothetical protein